MQRFVLVFLGLLVATLGRRLPPTPTTPSRGAWGLPGNHPYASWGICDEVCVEEIEAKIEAKNDKAVKQVKRSKFKIFDRTLSLIRYLT